MTPDNLPWYIAVPVTLIICAALVIDVLAEMRRDRNRRG